MKKQDTYANEDPVGELSVVADPNGERISNFKDLWVWQHSRELVKTVYKTTSTFPTDERFGLVSQLRRAAVSVPSNIAEGWARNKKGYLVQSLGYARGSLHEVETQLLVSLDLGYLSQDDIDPMLDSIAVTSSGILRFMDKLEG